MIKKFEKYTLNNNFWKWFGNSKIVDANGNPLIVYHGTISDFDVFDRTSGEFGGGIYFSRNVEDAQYYAMLKGDQCRNIVPVYLSLQNPYYHDIYYSKKMLPTRTTLIKRCHDGIIGKTANGTEEIVVFFPSQVKSAIGNNGDFDNNNPSILN